MTDNMQRTDSTQAMKSILSAYGEDEGAPDDIQSNIDDISGSDDDDGSQASAVEIPKSLMKAPLVSEAEKRVRETGTSSMENSPKKVKMERISTCVYSILLPCTVYTRYHIYSVNHTCGQSRSPN